VRIPFKSDGDRLARIETVTSDALNFAWPLRASMVATNALISIIELGYGDKLPRLADPLSAARVVGKHGSECRFGVLTKDGPQGVYPLDVIRQVCELAIDIDAKKQHLDKESDQVLREIIDVSDRMSRDPFSVGDQVESVARLAMMKRKCAEKKVSLGSETLCRLDYAWDWLGGGVAETLRNRGSVGWYGFDTRGSVHAKKKRLITPPTNTRAQTRGTAIAANKGANDSTWSIVEYEAVEKYIAPTDTPSAEYFEIR